MRKANQTQLNRNNPCYVGIDPGLNGAVGILQRPGFLFITDTPSVVVRGSKKEYVLSEMVRLLEGLPKDRTHVFIERVHSMPGQGVASMFSMGMGYGLWLGIISALGLPHTKISPVSWKKDMMQGMGKEKSASVVRAAELYPEAELFGPRGKALDGRGDALLIATYGMREYGIQPAQTD